MRKTLLLFFSCAFSIVASAQWLEQATGFTTASRGINQIVIIDKNIVWAESYDGSGSNASVRDYTLTTDGGSTWIPGKVPAPTSYNWSCLAAIDESTAWAMFYKASTGTTGRIYKTTDGGLNWTQQGSNIFTASTAFPDVIYFWDANTGVAVGDPVNGEYEIYTTADGGTTWNPVSGANIPNPTTGEYGLTRSFAARGNYFWFGTNDGRIFKSTDKGSTWTVYETGYPGTELTSITFANENIGWVNSTNPTDKSTILLRTLDGGNTFNNLTTPGADTVYQVGYVPYTINTIVSSWVNSGSYGSSYSLDGGDTWTEIDNGVQHLTVSFLSNYVGWSGGFNIDDVTGGIYKYTGSFVATGDEQIEESSSFNLYPNPSNGLFYFSYETENSESIQLRVTDAIGKIVFDKTYSDKTQTWLRSIDLRNFSKGIYFLDIENNGNHISKKLVIN